MAVSAALVAASGAAAAADVQIYGRVNTALFFQKVQSEDHAKLRMDNGASRFGLNISETLTDDLSVRGYLENGFNSGLTIAVKDTENICIGIDGVCRPRQGKGRA